jgi:hypothetical protein
MRPDRSTILLLAIACQLVGCDAMRSFEAVCETRLPATEIRVQADPIIHRVDESLSYDQLTAKGGDIAAAGRQVIGLTTAHLSSSVQVTARGMSRRTSERYCMRPVVSVRLSFNPMTVYMGSNDARASCQYKLTFEHEMHHVEIYRAFLPAITARVQNQLGLHFMNRVFYFASPEAGQKHIDEVVHDYLSPLVSEAMDEVRELQRGVDTPAEYARLDLERAACQAGPDGFGAVGFRGR